MEGAICSSRPCMGSGLAAVHTCTAIVSDSDISATALTSAGQRWCCVYFNLTQAAFEQNAAVSKHRPTVFENFCQSFGEKTTTTRKPERVPVIQQCGSMPRLIQWPPGPSLDVSVHWGGCPEKSLSARMPMKKMRTSRLVFLICAKTRCVVEMRLSTLT